MDTDMLLVGLAGLAFAAVLIFAMTGSVSNGKDENTTQRPTKAPQKRSRSH